MMQRYFARPSVAVALAALIACAAPQPRPEWGILAFPIEEAWETSVGVAKDWEFTLEVVDSSSHVLLASKVSATVIGGTPSPYERFGKATREQVHQLRVTMKPRGDVSTVVEIVYLIDKVPDEEASFEVLNAVRHRLSARRDR